MITPPDMTDLAYAQAEAALLSHADDDSIADGVTSPDECRRAYEAVRTELLTDYPELEGPVIGDLLHDAARAVWPAIVGEL